MTIKSSQWPGPTTSARVRDLCADVAERYSTPIATLFSRGSGARSEAVVNAKVQIMVALSRPPHRWTAPQIAKFFGCHHTNVYHHLGRLPRSTAVSQQRLERLLRDALEADLGGAHDPEAFAGPAIIRKTTGPKRREGEVDRLVKHGILHRGHVIAVERYVEALLGPVESGRDSIDALSSSHGAGNHDGAHHYRLRLAHAGISLRSLQTAIRDRVGIQGLSIVDGIIERRLTAADVAMRHGLTRVAPSGNILGDARQAHGLIRAAFDALLEATRDKALDVRHEHHEKHHHADLALTKTAEAS